jgi:tRNA A-37 threonylcarbamoyl transferase component Bud32
MALLEPGSIVGHYVVESILGDGGMATVHLVRHSVLHSRHALKVLSPDLLVHEDVRVRFLAEGRIQSALQHPNVVAVTDVVSEPGVAGLVMEYVEGPTLDAWLSRQGRLAPEEAAAVMTGLLAGAAAAHAKGVVHRDLKPSNVLLGRHPDGSWCPKILDFGIAKFSDGDSKGKTRTGARMGTVHYMSPEQVRGAARVDHRSDVWSLGVLLYELLTGRTPFEDVDGFATMQRIDALQYPPLESVRPDVPPALAGVVRKALQKSAEQRFEDCDAFALALRDAVATGPAGAPARPHRLSSVLDSAAPRTTEADSPPWWPSTPPLWMAFGVMAVAGIVAGRWGGDAAAAAGRPPVATGAARLAAALLLHVLLGGQARLQRSKGADGPGVARLWTMELAHVFALLGLMVGGVMAPGTSEAIVGAFFLALFSLLLASGVAVLLAGLGRGTNLSGAYVLGLAGTVATGLVVWTSPERLPFEALSTLLATGLRPPDTLLRVQWAFTAVLLLAGRFLLGAMAVNRAPPGSRSELFPGVVRTLAWLQTVVAASLGLSDLSVASGLSGESLAFHLLAVVGRLSFHGLWAARLHGLAAAQGSGGGRSARGGPGGGEPAVIVTRPPVRGQERPEATGPKRLSMGRPC